MNSYQNTDVDEERTGGLEMIRDTDKCHSNRYRIKKGGLR